MRSPEGVMLAGDNAATLTYVRTDSTRGYIAAQTGTAGGPQPIHLRLIRTEDRDGGGRSIVGRGAAVQRLEALTGEVEGHQDYVTSFSARPSAWRALDVLKGRIGHKRDVETGGRFCIFAKPEAPDVCGRASHIWCSHLSWV